MKIFTGNANRALAEEIVDYLGIPLGDADVFRFSDGEIGVKIKENVRGADVFVVQPTSHPINEHLMELLIMIDALYRASARRITAVIPYYGYARQDRKTQPREPITAKLVANLITRAGANRVLTCDLHTGQLQGFFDIPVDNLTAIPIMVDYIKSAISISSIEDELVVVSPDVGGVARARRMAEKLNTGLAIVDKKRDYNVKNSSQVMEVIGKVRGKVAILLDDIIDTAGTTVNAANALLERGAKEVYSFATHAVFSGGAIERIAESSLRKVVVTNTISIHRDCEKLKVLSIGPLLAEAIKRIHENRSVSILFR